MTVRTHREHIAPCGQLQWGHGLSTVDDETKREMNARYTELQWGHGLSTVDDGVI